MSSTKTVHAWNACEISRLMIRPSDFDTTSRWCLHCRYMSAHVRNADDRVRLSMYIAALRSLSFCSPASMTSSTQRTQHRWTVAILMRFKQSLIILRWRIICNAVPYHPRKAPDSARFSNLSTERLTFIR